MSTEQVQNETQQTLYTDELKNQAIADKSFIVVSPSLSEKTLLHIKDLNTIWTNNPEAIIVQDYRLFGLEADIINELSLIMTAIEEGDEANNGKEDDELQAIIDAAIQTELNKGYDFGQSKDMQIYQQELAEFLPKEPLKPKPSPKRPLSVVGRTASAAKPESKPLITTAAAVKANSIATGGKTGLTNTIPTLQKPLTGTKPGTKAVTTQAGRPSTVKQTTTRKTTTVKKDSLEDKISTLESDKLYDVTGFASGSGPKKVALPKTTNIKGYANGKVGIRAPNYEDFKAAYMSLSYAGLNDGVLRAAIIGFNTLSKPPVPTADDPELEDYAGDEVEEPVKPVVGRNTSRNTKAVTPQTITFKPPVITEQSRIEFMNKYNLEIGKGKYLNVADLQHTGKGAKPAEPAKGTGRATIYQDNDYLIRSPTLEKFKLAMELFVDNEEDDEEEARETKDTAIANAEEFFANKKGPSTAAAKLSPVQRAKANREAAANPAPTRVATSTLREPRATVTTIREPRTTTEVAEVDPTNPFPAFTSTVPVNRVPRREVNTIEVSEDEDEGELDENENEEEGEGEEGDEEEPEVTI